jgi:hypothetical protein
MRFAAGFRLPGQPHWRCWQPHSGLKERHLTVRRQPIDQRQRFRLKCWSLAEHFDPQEALWGQPRCSEPHSGLRGEWLVEHSDPPEA